MATRTLSLSGSANKNALSIRPAKVYVALDQNPANLKYIGTTTEEITVSSPREYAELNQDGVRYAIAEKSKDLSFNFAFHEVFNPDLLAIALGETTINTDDPLVDDVRINATSSALPEYLWVVKTTTFDGRDVEAGIWAGQVLNPEDFTLGVGSDNTEFGGVPITIEAVSYDNAGTDELGYIKITK